MRKIVTPLLLLLLVACIALLAYMLGRKSGNVTIENVATNNTIITQIAELSSLEVQGIATIKSTNLLNDGSLTDQMRKLLLENTINISVPYIAKYGVDLSGQAISVKEKDKVVHITLPEPRLLSYELRIDKADASIRKGRLLNASEAQYNEIQKRLYHQSRTQMEQNIAYKEQCVAKIKAILNDYYHPLQYTVDIRFAPNDQLLNTTPD